MSSSKQQRISYRHSCDTACAFAQCAELERSWTAEKAALNYRLAQSHKHLTKAQHQLAREQRMHGFARGEIAVLRDALKHRDHVLSCVQAEANGLRESMAPLEEALQWARGERAQLQLVLRQVLARLKVVEEGLGENDVHVEGMRGLVAALRNEVHAAQHVAEVANQEALRFRREALHVLTTPVCTASRMTPIYTNPLVDEEQEDDDDVPQSCCRAMDMLMEIQGDVSV